MVMSVKICEHSWCFFVSVEFHDKLLITCISGFGIGDSNCNPTDVSGCLLALGHVDLCVSHRNPSQELGLAIRELIHGSKRNVESARVSMVDSKHVDALASVSIGDLPASTAIRRVKTPNSESTANARESGQRAECGVAYQCVVSITVMDAAYESPIYRG